jgi:ParB family chromosome partitioning protein
MGSWLDVLQGCGRVFELIIGFQSYKTVFLAGKPSFSRKNNLISDWLFHVKHSFEFVWAEGIIMAERRLGRGLEYLIPSTRDKHKETVEQIPLRLVRKNRFQPREMFDDAKIQELAQSIKENGVIQPILVRQEGSRFELIAGERRLKACEFLKLESIPAIILNVSETQLLEYALAENIQREDLNPIEEARAFDVFARFQGLTHEEIAQKLGKHRTYVTNSLRLLDLPEKIQAEVSRGTISAGHARALLGLSLKDEMLKALEIIVKEGLSVRKTEDLVKNLSGRKGRAAGKRNVLKPPHIMSLEEQLRNLFNTRVEIQEQGKGGKLVFSYHTEEDLGRLFDMLVQCRKESDRLNHDPGL